jgi:alpha-L-rhamnosidase
VQVWDQSGAVFDSDILSFVTGKMSDAWQGEWIGNGTTKPFYARKTQSLNKEVKEAYALVCGLGQFVYYINGQKVGDHEMDPGWTNYDRLVQYVTFDVKSLLATGTNVFGLEIANGWYIADAGGRYFVKAPKMKFIGRFSKSSELAGYQPFSNVLAAIAEVHIVYEDGTRDIIVSDESWKTRESATLLANVHGSEIYDGRRFPTGWLESNFDDRNWKEALVQGAADRPKGTLTAQSQPPVYVKKVYEPISVKRVDDGLLYEMGQNMSGMLEIAVKGKAGQTIDLSPAEKLDENGSIDQSIQDMSIMEATDLNVMNTYILRGDTGGETWKQQFSYFGGCYILVQGASDDENDTKLPYGA